MTPVDTILGQDNCPVNPKNVIIISESNRHRFTLLPETTIKLDNPCEPVIFRHWTSRSTGHNDPSNRGSKRFPIIVPAYSLEWRIPDDAWVQITGIKWE